MVKGKWINGRESALWVGAVQGLRPGTLSQVCSFGLLGFIHAVARIVERAGDTACIFRVLLGSTDLCLRAA